MSRWEPDHSRLKNQVEHVTMLTREITNQMTAGCALYKTDCYNSIVKLLFFYIKQLNPVQENNSLT